MNKYLITQNGAIADMSNDEQCALDSAEDIYLMDKTATIQIWTLSTTFFPDRQGVCMVNGEISEAA